MLEISNYRALSAREYDYKKKIVGATDLQDVASSQLG